MQSQTREASSLCARAAPMQEEKQMVRSMFRVRRALIRQVACRVVLCAAVMVVVLLGNSAAQAQVVHLKGNRANGSGAVIVIDKPREGVPKTYIVLTAYHVINDNTH